MAERAHPEDPGYTNRWFGLKKNKYRKQLQDRYKFCNKYIRNKRVLDIPCGVGWGTSLLKGASSIIGIDVSTEAIDYAKQYYENNIMHFYVGDMKSLFLEDRSVDVILCLEGFEHVPQDVGLNFLQESQRVLTYNGILIMTCPVLNPDGSGSGNPYHLNEYREKDLRDLLEREFEIIKFRRFSGADGPICRIVLQNKKNGSNI